MGTAPMTTGPRRRSRPRVPARVRRRWPLSPPSARSAGHRCRSEHRSIYSRSYLPHFDAPFIAQGLTFRLADSVPRSVIDRWREEIGSSEVLRTDEARHQELLRRVARYEDAGWGECYLATCGGTRVSAESGEAQFSRVGARLTRRVREEYRVYFDRNATPSAAKRQFSRWGGGSGGMDRRSNAARVSPQAAQAPRDRHFGL